MKEYEIGHIISQEEYSDVAAYCNQKGDRTISLVDGKYIVTEIIISDEEVAISKRIERDRKLNSVTWRLERHQEQKQLGIETNDSADTYQKLLEYRQYLRNIPASDGFPYVDVLDFDTWMKTENIEKDTENIEEQQSEKESVTTEEQTEAE